MYHLVVVLALRFNKTDGDDVRWNVLTDSYDFFRNEWLCNIVIIINGVALASFIHFLELVGLGYRWRGLGHSGVSSLQGCIGHCLGGDVQGFG
jgi:hypothetical protein